MTPVHEPEASPWAATETLMLDRAKVAVSQRLSAQMADDSTITTYVDPLLDQMVVQLRSFVLQHQVDTQDVRVPFSRTETVEVAAPRLVVPIGVALVALGMVLGLAFGSLPTLLLTMAVALAFVALFAANPSREVGVTAQGEAVVHREQFNTFPENSVVYPKALGTSVRMATLSTAAEYR